MKVNEIRPLSLVEEQQAYIDSDISWLLSNKEDFKESNCPCCNSSNKSFKLQKNRFEYYDCLDCKTFYMSPRPTAVILKAFYSNSKNYEFWAQKMFPRTEKKRQNIFSKRVDLILEQLKIYNPHGNQLLEVGPGYGTFCNLLKQKKPSMKVKAVEPSKPLAEICKNSGIDVVNDTIENFSSSSNEKFDVIVCFEVIEHLSDPDSFLKSMRTLLNANGIIIFSCPNGLGFDVTLLQENSETIDHEHLNYFNPESVNLLLERAQLKEIETFTPGELDVSITRIANQKIKDLFENDKFLSNVFSRNNEKLDNMLQNLIKESKLSSNMFVIAKNL